MEAAPVLGNELGVDSLAVDVPDGAGGVDAGGADALGLGLVPVEGGEGVGELAVAVVVEEALHVDAGSIVGDPSDTEVVTGGDEEVGLLALLVRDEDNLRCCSPDPSSVGSLLAPQTLPALSSFSRSLLSVFFLFLPSPKLSRTPLSLLSPLRLLSLFCLYIRPPNPKNL